MFKSYSLLIGVIISGPISNLWMGIGGKHQNQAYGLTLLICIFGVILTMLAQVYLLNGLEGTARSYEDSVRYYIRERDDLIKRLNVTNENLKMSDVELLRCTRLGSADFIVGEISYRKPTATLSADEVRSVLEEERRKTLEKFNSLVEPEEPSKVAWWRKHILRQWSPTDTACAQAYRIVLAVTMFHRAVFSPRVSPFFISF